MLKLIKFMAYFKKKDFLKFNKKIDQTQIRASLKNKKNLTLYIHIPFCETHCEYCNFLKFKNHNKKMITSYYKYLKKEFDMHHKNGERFTNIYVGGGTPTINMDELIRLLSHIKKFNQIKNLSIETTLRDINEENLEKLKKIGVNRLSIGVQSFNKFLRSSINREEITKKELTTRIELAKKTFHTVNIDIIFNLPNQDLTDFKKEIDFFLKLGELSVTFYPLIPNKSEKSKKEYKKTDLKKEQTYYSYLLETLEKKRYVQNTSWHFSKTNKINDEYITESEDYIGLGCGSISYVNQSVHINTFSLKKYQDQISTNKLPISLYRKLSKKQASQYYLLTKLFGMKLEKKEYEQKFKEKITKQLWPEITALKLLGWIKEDKTYLTVTKKGTYPLGVIMREFFDSVSELRQESINKQV